MKKLSILLCIILLIGCSSPDNTEDLAASGENNEVVEKEGSNGKENEAKESHVNEGKETLDISEIEAEMIYSWDLHNEMKAYLIREDGEDSVYDLTTASGKRGQYYFEGDVSFYLVYDGDDIGYLQETISDTRIDLQNKKVNLVTLGESEFIGWITSEASSIKLLYLFVIQDEELEQVAFDNDRSEPDIVTASQVKAIDDEYIQTFTYVNTPDELSYHFFTYKWDADNKRFSEMKSTIYHADSEFPQDWYNTDAYANFGQYEISEDSIEQLKNGYLFDENIKIGDRLVEIENNNQFNLENSYYRGAETYVVDNRYEIIRDDENGEVPQIVYYPSLINQTYSEVYDVLGEPDDSSFFEMENADVEKYIYGDFVLELFHDDEYIIEINLRKKNEFD